MQVRSSSLTRALRRSGGNDGSPEVPKADARQNGDEIRIAVGNVVLYLGAGTPAVRLAEIVRALGAAS